MTTSSTATPSISSAIAANPSTSTIEHWSNYYGIPSWIPLSIAQTESGLNPNAQGDKTATGQATSFGLFQLHTPGGQGDGFTPSQLYDPSLNSQVAIGDMVGAYQEGTAQNLTGYNLLQYVASHSGHPDETGQMPSTYNSLLSKSYTTVTGQSASTTGGSTSTGGSSSSSTATGIEATIMKVVWIVVGVGVIALGIWLMFNPFADLTTAISGLGTAAAETLTNKARQPLTKPVGLVNRGAEKLRKKPEPESESEHPKKEDPYRLMTPEEQMYQVPGFEHMRRKKSGAK